MVLHLRERASTKAPCYGTLGLREEDANNLPVYCS